MQVIQADDFGTAWVHLLKRLRYGGTELSPRGKLTHEMCGVNFVVLDGHQNLLVHPKRNLQFKFAVAEWLWIWFGHRDVATIARYNSRIGEFSDDGKTFAGAYGPPVMNRWPIILQTLQRDINSRQAVIPIWSVGNPAIINSKDVPCTISLQFLVRDGRVNVIANMRSSDVWLGLPYDFFNFSMFGNILAGQLDMKLGSVQMILGSSHLYEENFSAAVEVIEDTTRLRTVRSPSLLLPPPVWLDGVLKDPRSEFVPEDRWPWTNYGWTLCASRNVAAQLILEDLLRYEPTEPR